MVACSPPALAYCQPSVPAASLAADVSQCFPLPRCQVSQQTLPAYAAHTHPASGMSWGTGRGENPILMEGPTGEPPSGAPHEHSPLARPPLTLLALLPKVFRLLMARGGGRKNIQQTIAKVKSEQEGGCEQGGLPNPVVFLGDADNNGRNIEYLITPC